VAVNLFKFELGYIGAASALIRGAGTYLAKGSRNWLITGINRIIGYRGPVLQAGIQGGRHMMQAAESYGSLGTADRPGVGSIWRVLTALFFIGAGKVRYKGLDTGATATSTLSLRLLENGAYNGTTYQAGLAQPSAPTIFTRAAGGGFTGTELIAGTRALVLFRIRSTTGAVSVASLPSNVVITQAGDTVVLTAPLADSNGQDRWGVGAPLAGRGEIGPFFILMEIPESDFAAGVVDGISRSVELEWSDAALTGADLVPIDDFPPPPAQFGGTLNDTGFLDGCYGDTAAGQAPAALGSTIVLSLPGKFESWPPDSLVFTPQPPTALSSRGADGYAYRAGLSTLGALTYTGGNPPISYQLRWPNAGCVAPHNMVIAGDGRLYIFTTQYGLARIGEGDEPDTEWALPFSEDVIGWNPAEVVMGEDGSRKNTPLICACHRKIVLPYNRAAERACTPCDLTGKIIGNIIAAVNADSGEMLLCTNNVRAVSDVTANNGSAVITSPTAAFTAEDVGKTVELAQASPGTGTLTTTILSVDAANQVTLAAAVTWTAAGTTYVAIDTTLRLYKFDGGTGMVSEAYTPWIATEEESDQVFAVAGAVTVDNIANPVEIKLLFNGKPGNVARTWQKRLPTAGFNHLYTERPNLINAKSHALYVKVTGTGGETALDSLHSVSEPDSVTISG
jgi:hypothetical protein